VAEKTVLPLDRETWELASRVMRDAPKAGLDKIEALHEAGLITTAAERKAIRVDAIKYVLDLLTTWTPLDFLGRHGLGRPATPTDMYNCILGFLAEVQQKERNDDDFRVWTLQERRS